MAPSIRIAAALRRGIVLALVVLLASCASDWPAFRHNALRTGGQLNASALSNPSVVPGLHIATGWPFQPAGAQAFRASPMVYQGRVFIGNANGRFYAVDAVSGALLWQYPAAAAPALTSQFTCNPSSEGIASSAAIATIGGVTAVIFAAPDRSIGAGLGSGRLFALDAATGAEIWKSPEVARLTGTTGSSTTELHEQIGYSSPLVANGRVYVGVANHCDNPIQNGRIVAVHLATGVIDAAFSYASTNARGGGIWGSVAVTLDGKGVFATTGNARCWNGGCQSEPSVNHSLSMVRVDAATGALVWKHQPVPFAMDADPDWAAGPATLLASCGTLIASTMKDGWTYAVDAGNGTAAPPGVRWQFPPTGFPFTPGDGTTHGDTRYLRPGAAWGDVFITNAGGLNLTASNGIQSNYSRLHALNGCAAPSDRVRWIKDVPHASGAYSLGPPTVTRGIVYIGTSTGHLIAIADPSLAPAPGWRCTHPDVPTASCVASGFSLVPDPAVLADVTLNGSILTEPALARGRVYVATGSGRLYMLQP